MKKEILLFAAIFAFVGTHVHAAKLLSFGVEAGLNVNQLSLSKDMFSSSNRAGFFVGPKMKIKVPLLGFGFDVAALYSYNTTKIDNITYTDPTSGESQVVSSDLGRSLSFIQIPLNIRYDFTISVVTIYLATGPQFNWCLNPESSLTEEIPNVASLTYNKTSWAWNVGAGVELFKHFQIGASYSIPISSNGACEIMDGKSITNIVDTSGRTGSIRLAYIF